MALAAVAHYPGDRSTDRRWGAAIGRGCQPLCRLSAHLPGRFRDSGWVVAGRALPAFGYHGEGHPFAAGWARRSRRFSHETMEYRRRRSTADRRLGRNRGGVKAAHPGHPCAAHDRCDDAGGVPRWRDLCCGTRRAERLVGRQPDHLDFDAQLCSRLLEQLLHLWTVVAAWVRTDTQVPTQRVAAETD